MPKVNGTIGLDDDDFDIATWQLAVDGLAGGAKASLTLADIQAFPKTEFVTELKCVEGWSRRVRWGGTRLVDFARRYRPARPGPDAYVGLATPGNEYYVSLDMASALHPQTLLCYEMEGRPLTYSHGAPLRLAIPIKYGIKNLKCIGRLSFTKSRPPDFWAERGYDEYAGF
ncbi:Oxidoreductase, molybdopterin binding (fragment) [Candidatus Sulfopaludibacter sp. SbA3]